MKNQETNTSQAASSIFSLPAVLLLGWAIFALVVPPAIGEPLFTEEEAELLRYSDSEWLQMQQEEQYSATKSITSGGPAIELIEPRTKKNRGIIMVTPASLHLRFISTKEPVDMHSLKMIGKKFFVKMDLTDRLIPYIRGQEVIAQELDIPIGKFTLDVEIADNKGTVTQKRYKVIVKN